MSKRKKPCIEEFLHSLHMTGLHYEGGISGLAREMSMREMTLVTKLTPGDERHFPHVLEFIGVLNRTGDLSSLHMLNAMFGLECREPVTTATEKSVVNAILSANSEHADIGKLYLTLTEDGDFSAKDRVRLLREIKQAEERLAVLKNTVLAEDAD